MSEWISVRDRQPQTNGMYLAWIIPPSGSLGEVFPVEWDEGWNTGWLVTHWQPLPDPPVA